MGGRQLARWRCIAAPRFTSAFLLLLPLLGAGALSAAAARPFPLPDKRPPGWIALDKVANGCGREGSLFRAHDQTYETDRGEKVTVDFTEACDLHDAAYSGALVWDGISGTFVDFSDRKWTKEAINEKFKHDLQRLCFRAFPDAAGMGAENALLECLTSRDVRKNATWGALSFYDIVNSLFGASPRARIDLSAHWNNTDRSWPLCDVGGHRPVKITQNGREIRAEWQHGADAGYGYGEFRGTLITGGGEGDDVVVGEYTITRGKAGPKVTGGAMTFKVLSVDKIDFNGAGPGGTLVRAERSTEGLFRATPSCKALPRSKPARPTVTTPAAARTATTLRLTLTGPQGSAWAERDLKTLGAKASPADPTVTAKITEKVAGSATLAGGTLAAGEILFVFTTHKTADSTETVYLCQGRGSCSFTMPANPPGRAAREEAVASICTAVPPKTNLGQGCVTSFNLRVDVQWVE